MLWLNITRPLKQIVASSTCKNIGWMFTLEMFSNSVFSEASCDEAWGDEQHWCTPRNSTLTFSFPHLHLWLQLQLWNVPPTEVLRWLLHRGLHQWGQEGRVQRWGGGLCQMVRGEPPPAQYRQDQGDDGGLPTEQEALKPHGHPRGWNRDSGLVQVPWSEHKQ